MALIVPSRSIFPISSSGSVQRCARGGRARSIGVRFRSWNLYCRQYSAGICAALSHDVYSAYQYLEHDKINLLCLEAQIVSIKLAAEILDVFLQARFSLQAEAGCCKLVSGFFMMIYPRALAN